MFGRFKKKKGGDSSCRKGEEGDRGLAGTLAFEDSKGGKGRAHTGRNRIKIDLLIHDLKGPLAVMEAGIKSLMTKPEKYGPVTEMQERVLSRVLRNIKATQTMVGDALELGKSREGVMNPTAMTLSDIVEYSLTEVFDLVQDGQSDEIGACRDLQELKEMLNKRGIQLEVDSSLWCCEVRLDVDKIKQILRNLMNNALKYRKSNVELSIQKEDDSIIFSVGDDGEGIPPEYHKKIFECYFQLDHTDGFPLRGHGLGLAGVMVLVEDMGGELALDSDAGKGTRFVVKIPCQ